MKNMDWNCSPWIVSIGYTRLSALAVERVRTSLRTCLTPEDESCGGDTRAILGNSGHDGENSDRASQSIRVQLGVQSINNHVGAAIRRPAYRSGKFVSDLGECATKYDFIVGANCIHLCGTTLRICRSFVPIRNVALRGRQVAAPTSA